MARTALLGMVVSLALGLISLAMLARLPREITETGIRRLPVTLLLYNLWVAAFLALSIVQADDVAAHGGMALAPVDGWKMGLLALALTWLYAHIAQLEVFAGTKERSWRRTGNRILAGFGAIIVTGGCIAVLSGTSLAFRYAVAFVSVAVFPTALLISVAFFMKARRRADPDSRSRYARLGAAYVVLFVCLTALSFGWIWLASISPSLPVAADVILEGFYNLIAIVWLTRVVTWGSQQSAVAGAHTPATQEVAALLATHGITKREGEIIQLICLGKTNQEIADELFISLATVKDHNYVAFQKLGVRNRTELTHRILQASLIQPK